MHPGSSALWIAAVGASVLLGIAGGVGAFTFLYADGISYLGNNPATCANCHVMQEQYDGWQKSSHHTVATCNDCHTPAAFVPKYLTKALNGWHPSTAFPSGNFHEPIQIGERNRAITEGQCRHCHGDIAAMIEGPRESDDRHPAGREALECSRCHESVGHLH